MTSRYAALTREQLATLVPELLLIGQLIDRSGMAWCISSFGRRRCCRSRSRSGWAPARSTPGGCRRRCNYEGVDVITIFKGLQLDIGAPPQFMDFRYTVHDRWHGEFHLDHCGALMDVEPMGEDYVRGMCHDIEDPTFDATAVATNRRAQIRPIHRPPRTPADRHPHCAWTVIIDESHPEVADHPALEVVARTRAAHLELDPIDTGDEGSATTPESCCPTSTSAPFSHSALVRMADEVCLQMHLLNLSFVLAVGARAGTNAGAGPRHLHQAADRDRRARRRTHPRARWTCRAASTARCGCSSCTRCSTRRPTSTPNSARTPCDVRRSPAHEDGAWIVAGAARPSAGRCRQRSHAVDPHLDVEVTGHRYRLDRARVRGRHRGSRSCREVSRWRSSAAGRRSSSSPQVAAADRRLIAGQRRWSSALPTQRRR